MENGSQYKDAVKRLEQVKAGAYSIFAKIICRDTTHLHQVFNEHIQAIDGIQCTETFISLEESIKRQISLN